MKAVASDMECDRIAAVVVFGVDNRFTFRAEINLLKEEPGYAGSGDDIGRGEIFAKHNPQGGVRMVDDQPPVVLQQGEQRPFKLGGVPGTGEQVARDDIDRIDDRDGACIANTLDPDHAVAILQSEVGAHLCVSELFAHGDHAGGDLDAVVSQHFGNALEASDIELEVFGGSQEEAAGAAFGADDAFFFEEVQALAQGRTTHIESFDQFLFCGESVTRLIIILDDQVEDLGTDLITQGFDAAQLAHGELAIYRWRRARAGKVEICMMSVIRQPMSYYTKIFRPVNDE